MTRQARAFALLVTLPVLPLGCGSERQLPTAPTREMVVGLQGAEPGRMEHDQGRRHVPHPVLVAQAKEALSAVLTGEETYYQRWVTYVDVPETADFGAVLGVFFGDLLKRWAFSVTGASTQGFTAVARERDGSEAEFLTITLTFQRGQPPVWRVQRRRLPANL